MNIYVIAIIGGWVVFGTAAALCIGPALKERRERDTWPVLDEWESDTEASIVEALALVEPTPVFDQLAAEHAAMDRDLAVIRDLPETGVR